MSEPKTMSVEAALAACVTGVTKSWKAAKRQADRDDRLSRSQLERQRETRRARPVTIVRAAYHVMEQAYLKASANGTLPANARQIMYAARPLILRYTSKPWEKSTHVYFTQHLLPDYMKAYPQKTAGWDVVFDARGHFREPHTGEGFGIGTLEVRRYFKAWRTGVGGLAADGLADRLIRVPTKGPANRFGAVLFVEKEGFDPLLKQSGVEERFDLAIMSTKGMSVTAARKLVEELSRAGLPIYVLRDFDKAGFSIVHTMRTSTRRYTFTGGRPNVVDLGLRLEDVEAMGLDSEEVDYPSGIDPKINLRLSGATAEECAFLVDGGGGRYGWSGRRVELNAMASDQFIEWLEQKLEEAGVKKVVPDDETLGEAYRRARRLAGLRRAIKKALAGGTDGAPEGSGTPTPADLRERIEEALADDPTQAWDDVLAEIADDDDAEETEEDG